MKKLLIDLEKCYKCPKCEAKCSYHYHPGNEGYIRCIALGIQEHVCRRCEEPPCVNSCPREALKKREDGMIDRYSMRCISCKNCTIACPFGVIIPEIVEYKTSACDLSSDRSDDNTPPVCVDSCPQKAIEWVEVSEDPSKNIYAVRGGRYFVRAIKWQK
jgi:Fe-S-cluster-containing dehydrogenase component